MAEEHKRQFVLPPSLAEPADVARAAREIDAVDDVLREAEIRAAGSATVLPRMSKGLLDMAEMNGLNLLQQTDRAKTVKLLEALAKVSPVLHISFAAEPSPSFVNAIITKLRQSIHPYVLVQIGLQPSLAGGCMVRTENKMFDFSLRQHLQKHKHKLTEILTDMGNKTAEQAAARAAADAAIARHKNPDSDPEAAQITQPAQAAPEAKA